MTNKKRFAEIDLANMYFWDIMNNMLENAKNIINFLPKPLTFICHRKKVKDKENLNLFLISFLTIIILCRILNLKILRYI